MQAFRKAAQRFGWKQQADGERMSGITANWSSSSQRQSLFRKTFSHPTPQVSEQVVFFSLPNRGKISIFFCFHKFCNATRFDRKRALEGLYGNSQGVTCAAVSSSHVKRNVSFL